jgi:hypothetical protein
MNLHALLHKPYFALRQKRNALRKTWMRRKILKGAFPTLPQSNDAKGMIVSLTSHSSRVQTTLPFAIYSLFLQTELPGKITVWLNEKQWNAENIPQELKAMQAHGLEVHFCEDVGPHTKLVPARLEYPDATIVTADDDILYPKDWFLKLKNAQKERPNAIIFNGNSDVCACDDGSFMLKSAGERKIVSCLPLGVCGVAYPPHSLHESVADFLLLKKLTPTADDIWFWACAQLQGTEYLQIAKRKMNELDYVDLEENDKGLFVTVNANGGNGRQLNSVIEHFPELKRKLLEAVK